MNQIFKVCAIGFFIALMFSFIPHAFCAYTVGVKSGDWMKYHVSLTWTGTEPGTDDFGELGEAEYMKGEVLTVEGTSVTAKMSMHMKNGSDVEQTLIGNVATGEGNLTIFIIPSGMEQGDNFPSVM